MSGLGYILSAPRSGRGRRNTLRQHHVRYAEQKEEKKQATVFTYSGSQTGQSDATLLRRHQNMYRDNNSYGRVHIMHRPLFDPLLNVNNGFVIARLPNRTIETATKEISDSCSVCWQEWKDGDVVKTLPCLHYFHSKCIETWLQTKLNCPLCRAEINRFI